MENIERKAGISSPLGVGGNMFHGALPIHFEFARKLRANQTASEAFLWQHLKSIQTIPKVRFRRQHPILHFIADFYCHKAKIIIEIDGAYHDTPDQYFYDKCREAELEALGLKVIRFTNDQVLGDIETVLNKIKEELKNTTELVV
jgi:very-short-patch-repair endonuclease